MGDAGLLCVELGSQVRTDAVIEYQPKTRITLTTQKRLKLGDVNNDSKLFVVDCGEIKAMLISELSEQSPAGAQTT